MNRKTLISLAAFVVLGIGAVLALRRPEVGERTGDKPRPVAKIAAADIDTLEVTRNGATTVIKKEGGKYKVTSPIAYAADETAAKNAFEALEKLEFANLVTDQKVRQAEFEVEDAKAVRVVAKGTKQGNVLVDLLVGKASGSGTMVRPSGNAEIWETNGSIRNTFDKAAADWRDKSITTFTAGDAEKIDIKAKDGSTIALKKNGEKWEVASSSLKIDKLDDTVAGGIVTAMAALKAGDFFDGPKGAYMGIDPPSLTVTVGLKGGKSATVVVGNKKGTEDDFFVKAPEAPQVFLVKKYALERLAKRPIEFRDKTLCNVADADFGDISVASSEKDKSYAISKSGSDWKASKPAKLEVDSSKVTPIMGAFKDWKASSFAEDSAPAVTGLDKPKAVISAKSKKAAESCTIKIGNETKDKQSYFVQSAKGSDVLLVPKWSADRILVKPDDLKKPASTSVAKK